MKHSLWFFLVLPLFYTSSAGADALTWPNKDLPYDEYLADRERTYVPTEWTAAVSKAGASDLGDYYLKKAQFVTPGPEVTVSDPTMQELRTLDRSRLLKLASDFAKHGKKAAHATALQIQKDLTAMGALRKGLGDSLVNPVVRKAMEVEKVLKPELSRYFEVMNVFEEVQRRNWEGFIRLTQKYEEGQTQLPPKVDTVTAIANLIDALPDEVATSLEKAGVDVETLFEEVAEEVSEASEARGTSETRLAGVAADKAEPDTLNKKPALSTIPERRRRQRLAFPTTPRVGLPETHRKERKAETHPWPVSTGERGKPRVERFEPILGQSAADTFFANIGKMASD